MVGEGVLMDGLPGAGVGVVETGEGLDAGGGGGSHPRHITIIRGGVRGGVREVRAEGKDWVRG